MAPMQDIKVGTGVSPMVGYQITVNYVAMNSEGRAFDSSIEKGAPYDIRCDLCMLQYAEGSPCHCAHVSSKCRIVQVGKLAKNHM